MLLSQGEELHRGVVRRAAKMGRRKCHHLLLLLVGVMSVGEGHALSLPSPKRPMRPVLLSAAQPSPPAANAQGVTVAWGVCGFLGILASAIGRLAPIALQPILQRDLSLIQWGLYAPLTAWNPEQLGASQ